MSTVAPPIPAVGQVVRCRGRAWLVDAVEPSAHGTLLALSCLEDDSQGEQAEVIWEAEIGTAIIDEESWRKIGSKGFDETRFFSAFYRTLRWNCVTATDPRLFQSPFRAGIRVEPYQLEPLRKALLLPRVNLFIADDVGLGKTIEAGLITSELLLRRRVRDIVVVCPPSMLPQWREELETRFGLVFQVLDRLAIERIREQHGWSVNPWNTYPRWLVSSRLLIDEAYKAPLMAWLGDTVRPASLLIFDEAHHAAPSSNNRYAIDSRITRTIRDIAPRFEHRLFLSATPHNGHSNSFSALLEILDPNRFIRGVPVRVKDLEPVMVRRLKEDIRLQEGGFPERVVKQIDIDALPADAPELVLPALLDEYRTLREKRLGPAAKEKEKAQALLPIVGLQHRLFSSFEAFARTLAAHRAAMEKVWAREAAGEPRPAAATVVSAATAAAAITAPDADDERADLPEEELAATEDDAVAAVTDATPAATAAPAAQADQERALLDQMQSISEAARRRPDARIRALVAWLADNACPAIRAPGERAKPGASTAWSDIRVLIFTEWEDTARYLQQMLASAISGTDDADRRIAVYRGSTSSERREELKRAFNANPATEPLRILIATDAAREGLNLQGRCHNLFHFDLPWNPGRLDQRNGRIDRKLQPAAKVFCHYFVHTQRPEDRVLTVLVEKTERIAKELGSLSQVLASKVSAVFRGGIDRRSVEKLAADLDDVKLDPEAKKTIDEEFEATRTRREQIAEEIDLLRTRIGDAKRAIGLDEVHLRDALSCALELNGVPPLAPAPLPPAAVEAGEPPRFTIPNLDTRLGRETSWRDTLDTLREPPDAGPRDFAWRREKPIRPVVFDAPRGLDDSVVQLHLEHRLVKRLLGQFLAQGLRHDDLSRACLAQSSDAIPRVVLLGRLSLYGHGAVRLHQEILTVTAKWVDPTIRRTGLEPYKRTAEADTMRLLEESLRPDGVAGIPPAVRDKLLAALPRDIEELLPQLLTRGEEHRIDAEQMLAKRATAESESLRKVLLDQKERTAKKLDAPGDPQLELKFNDDEKRQRDLERRAWKRFLDRVDADIAAEPGRILDFYAVAAHRIEPVGIAYLWPVTG